MDDNRTANDSHDIIQPTRLIIGHATSPIPIVSDGFGSPHTSAQTPPGVITKTDSRIAKGSFNFNTGIDRPYCINCDKRDNCICKKCVCNELQFYSRKERIAQQKKKKQDMDALVNEKFRVIHELVGEINNTEAKKSQLLQEIEAVQKRVEGKKKLLSSLSKSIDASRGFCVQLNELTLKSRRHLNDYEQKQKEKATKLKITNKNLWGEQVRLSLCVFLLFRLKKLFGESVPVVSPSSKDHWMMVNGMLPPERGTVYQIGAAKITEASREKLASSPSVHSLPFELRSPFAALLYTVELLTMLTMIFEFSLPSHISYREIATREALTKEEFHNNWNTICDLCMCLGHYLGLKPEQVNYNDPLSNLLEISNFLFETGDRKPPTIEYKNRHYRIHTTISKLHMREQEMKEWDVLDMAEVQQELDYIR